jgi:hypothetical protein
MLNQINHIKTYSIGDRGKNSKIITIPKIWIEATGAKIVDVHRLELDGKDVLVIVSRETLQKNN